MDQLSETAVDAVAKLARESQSIITTVSIPTGIKGVPSSFPVLLDRATGKVTSIAGMLEPWRTKPERKEGTAKAETLQSFIDLIERHKQENSVIFGITDWRKPSLTAIIDYHSGSDPDNGKHRILYEFPQSEEWKAWVAVNGKPMGQVEFAEFIEDHIAELSAPDSDEEQSFERMFGAKVAHPNELVALSRGLQVNAETRVKNAIKLQSGESQIMFEEDHRGADGQPLTVPGVFILSLPPFFQGESIRIPVRLRYRVREGVLSWTCMLYRPDVYITKQVNRDLYEASAVTELPKFEGRPEMAGSGV